MKQRRRSASAEEKVTFMFAGFLALDRGLVEPKPGGDSIPMPVHPVIVDENGVCGEVDCGAKMRQAAALPGIAICPSLNRPARYDFKCEPDVRNLHRQHGPVCHIRLGSDKRNS